jgi:prolyl 4-hydroxylase
MLASFEVCFAAACLSVFPSGVVDSKTGASEVSEVRTSSGMFFARAEDHVIESIERRISEWTLMPVGRE